MRIKDSKKSRIFLRRISHIIGIAVFSVFLFLFLILVKMNLFPIKYLIFLGGIASFFVFLFCFICIPKKRKRKTYIFTSILLLFFLIGEVAFCFFFHRTIALLKNLKVQYNTDTYYVLVNQNSKFNSVQEIQTHSLQVLKDLENMKPLEKKIKEKFQGTIEYNENRTSIVTNLLLNQDLVVVLNAGHYEAMVNVDAAFEKQVKILDTIEIQTKLEQAKTSLSKISEPFILYISGIDTRSGSLPKYSLSDVNIILAVNPKTKKILMIHIPRDSYVQLHGTTGLKDKLTHAGTLGGVNLSIATIEDLLEIKIPYYVRVNFNSVIRLVDAIGGIEVDSDLDRTFKIGDCVFQPGKNQIDGKCALAFARERHIYQEGDKHRGENQEQILQKVFEKISQSTTLLTKYQTILKTLEGTFETNLTAKEMTNFIKMQLNDMSTWKIETSNLDGIGDMLYTRSYPTRVLYVMHIDDSSMENALAKLKEILKN